MVKKELILDWVRHAKSDLITARHMFEYIYPKEIEISAWHSQQCAEKALKAFLVAHNIEPPRTHDLDELVKLCQNIDGSFSEMLYDCQKINPYGSVVRYPNELDVDETIVKMVIGRAQKVYDFCVIKTNQLIQNKERELPN
jgi:HEPN domain-containing protein